MNIRNLVFWIILGLFICVFEKILENVVIVFLLIITFYLLIEIIKQLKDLN